MTREHKLEAALRAILSAGRDGCDRCRFQDWRCWAEAREVLATPPTKPQQTTMPDWDDPPYTRSSCKVTTKRYNISPSTSEWNEAIEAAAEVCDGRAVDCDYESDTSIELTASDQSGAMRQLAEDIRALKRKD